MSRKVLCVYVALIVGALFLPEVQVATDGARRSKTTYDLRAISKVLDQYRSVHAQYPGTDDLLVPLLYKENALVSDDVPLLPRTDGWGHEYQYWADGERFLVFSSGSRLAARALANYISSHSIGSTGALCSVALGQSDDAMAVADGMVCERVCKSRDI